MKIATSNASTKPKANSKARRFIPPEATSVKWSQVDFEQFRIIAAGKLAVPLSKLGGTRKEVFHTALNCYGAKDLAFILSSLGFNDLPYPKGKPKLINAIVDLLADDARLRAFAAPTETEQVASPATAKSTKSSSGASLVSISPVVR